MVITDGKGYFHWVNDPIPESNSLENNKQQRNKRQSEEGTNAELRNTQFEERDCCNQGTKISQAFFVLQSKNGPFAEIVVAMDIMRMRKRLKEFHTTGNFSTGYRKHLCNLLLCSTTIRF